MGRRISVASPRVGRENLIAIEDPIAEVNEIEDSNLVLKESSSSGESVNQDKSVVHESISCDGTCKPRILIVDDT